MSDYEHDGNIFTGIEDELREHREYEKNYYSGGGGGKEPQGCGSFFRTDIMPDFAKSDYAAFSSKLYKSSTETFFSLVWTLERT